jgi:hypothetical protein
MIIQGSPRQHSGYRLNALLNIGNNISNHANILIALLPIIYCPSGTFLIFRILTLGWMTRWLVVHREEVPVFAYTLGSVGT